MPSRCVEKDSKEAPSIRLCDLLLGAVVDAWNRRAVAPAKIDLAAQIASYLGWSDLRAPTFAIQRKFNGWFLQNPIERDEAARRVNLRIPLPSSVRGTI
jgi:hypothetical protein